MSVKKDKGGTLELRRVIKASGLRSTSARVSVLEVLAAAEMPISHPELAGNARLAGFDRATIYRNLMDLTDAGLLSRTDLGDHVWRFELKDKSHESELEHPHFVCTDCGTVSCLPDVTIELRASRRGSRREIQEVLLRGRCEHCV